jgi:hypothetical protein
MPKMNKEQDIVMLIKEDLWMMNILRAVQCLNLPDCWVCAGFIRSKVWDYLHDFNNRTLLQDVDVVYFDKNLCDVNEETNIEKELRDMIPDVPWSVKNQARMHLRNGDSPYTSSTEAISKFTETATAIGVSLDSQNELILTAPCGIDDLINLVVSPTPYIVNNAAKKAEIYENRLKTKKWEQHWHQLKFVHVLLN